MSRSQSSSSVRAGACVGLVMREVKADTEDARNPRRDCAALFGVVSTAVRVCCERDDVSYSTGVDLPLSRPPKRPGEFPPRLSPVNGIPREEFGVCGREGGSEGALERLVEKLGADCWR